jgi:hypothetical protein
VTTWGPPCQADRVSIKLFGATETWHKAGIYAVKYAELLALRTKYGRFLARRQEAGNTSDVQTYACRPIRGSSTGYSYHSWPRALDVRPAFNGLRDDGVLESDFTRFGLLDGVRFVGAFFAAGFDWGSTWDDTDGETQDQKCRLARRDLLRVGKKIRDGRVDAMHFECDDDSDAWSRERALAKLRRYRVLNPVYMRGVLKQAKAESLTELLSAWETGRA